MMLYLSGPMTGYPNNNRPAFARAAASLRAAGYEVWSPGEQPEIPDGTLLDYLAIDLPELLRCDGVAVLPGWLNSRGAQLEVKLAEAAGLPVFQAAEWRDAAPRIAARQATHAKDKDDA